MITPATRHPGLLSIAIKLTLASTFSALSSFTANTEDAPAATPAPPDILLGPLFNDVQTAKLFPDQRTFANAVPNSDPLMILADYRMQKNQSGFDLRHLVQVNFTLPKNGEKYVPPAGQSLREHIDGLWPVLTRSTTTAERWNSLLPFPEPYVVPGGRLREIYHWDSYLTMLGLAESNHWDKVSDMVANFAYEIDSQGHIPNGNHTYYLNRSQPPFFVFMVELLAQHDGNNMPKRYLPQMLKEYSYWAEGTEVPQPGQQNKRMVKLGDGTVLNRYWDRRDSPRSESQVEDIATAKSNLNRPAIKIYHGLRSAAASGRDFSSRRMDNPNQLGTLRTTSIVPVGLNVLIYKMEKMIALASKVAGDDAKAAQYDGFANARQKGTKEYLWNGKEGWYADYDLKSHKVRNQLTAAALFPLYANAATKDRANKVATATQAHLLQPGGLATTSVKNGQQWDAPNSQAPLQWVAVSGLQNYGQDTTAMDVTWRFLTSIQHTYDREKKLVEKYDVSTTGTDGGGGEYPLQDGFGRTNGVTPKMLDLICAKEKSCDNVPASRPTSAGTAPVESRKQTQPTP